MLLSTLKSKIIEAVVFRQPFFGIVKEKYFRNDMILMYHGISKEAYNVFNTRHSGVKEFESQLKILKQRFHVISLSDFFEQKFKKGKKNIAITFDDGYLNNYTNAIPLLQQYNLPATIFITGINNTAQNILWPDFVDIISHYSESKVNINGEQFIKKGNCYYSDERNLSLANIIKHYNTDYNYKLKVFEALSIIDYRKVANNEEYWKLMRDEHIVSLKNSDLISIGSHGYYHNNLGNIPLQDAINELSLSKKYLEKLLQKEVNAVAYPDGSYNEELLTAAYNMGFKIQLAADKFLADYENKYKFLKHRSGLYSTGGGNEQLFNALRQ
jgi:peptidoglycan/xylan/chitin deacetylase (PgdA/CDA1 family)